MYDKDGNIVDFSLKNNSTTSTPTTTNTLSTGTKTTNATTKPKNTNEYKSERIFVQSTGEVLEPNLSFFAWIILLLIPYKIVLLLILLMVCYLDILYQSFFYEYNTHSQKTW